MVAQSAIEDLVELFPDFSRARLVGYFAAKDEERLEGEHSSQQGYTTIFLKLTAKAKLAE